MASPSPAKVSVECPHCGFKQMEYAAAKSSICRQCGRYFSPFAPKPGLKLRVREEAPRLPRPAPPSSANLRIFGNGSRALLSSVSNASGNSRSAARLPRQSARHAAHILICATTKITSGFSRTIRTRGDVHLTAKGDLGSSSVDLPLRLNRRQIAWQPALRRHRDDQFRRQDSWPH